jgi:hypothetical protein
MDCATLLMRGPRGQKLLRTAPAALNAADVRLAWGVPFLHAAAPGRTPSLPAIS